MVLQTPRRNSLVGLHLSPAFLAICGNEEAGSFSTIFSILFLFQWLRVGERPLCDKSFVCPCFQNFATTSHLDAGLCGQVRLGTRTIDGVHVTELDIDI